MPYRPYIRLLFIIGWVVTGYRGYDQTPSPTCTNHYYMGSYGLTGDILLRSLATAPDGCIYMGCQNQYNYAIIKLDSLGDTIHCRTYTTALVSPNTGKTIIDYDGNLFSVAANNYILRTDTAGNILSAKNLSLPNNTIVSLTDLGMLANGDKVFLFSAPVQGYSGNLLVTTSPDASIIRWTKYFSTSGISSARMLADGDKIILGVTLPSLDPNSYASGSGLLQLDGSTGNILRQQWFTDQLNFQGISRYNNGYLVNGTLNSISFYGNPAFYMRTDLSLNVLAKYSFPSYVGQYSSFTFQPQPDGSVYGIYSTAYNLTLFLISPGDVIQWGNAISSFYQIPAAMTLNPAGIFFGTWYSGNGVGVGEISGVQLYKASYSGYFPPCLNAVPATLTMSPLPLTPGGPTGLTGNVTGVVVSDASASVMPGPQIGSDNSCTITSVCNSIHITGNPAVCSGSGVFTGTKNAGCLLPVTWTVTRGPGNAVLQTNPANNTVSASFDKDGDYMLTGTVTTACASYADSILVHVNSGGSPTLGHDTTLCAGDSLFLRPGNAYSSYGWQNGSTDSVLLAKTPGLYTVNVQDYCGNSFSTSINIIIRLPTASPFPSDLTKCIADTLSVAIPPGFDSVSFIAPAANAIAGNNAIRFFNSDVSIYHLREKDSYNCPVLSDITVHLYPQPVIFLGNDTSICPGDSILLDAGSGLPGYLWNTGNTGQTLWAGSKGDYWVQTVTANGCIVRDSLNLSTYTAPVVSLDPDTILCAGSSRQLSAGTGYAAYLWNDGSTASSLTVAGTGEYWVMVTDGHGCTAADMVKITSRPCLVGFYIPNAFTPNGDGTNDIFRPLVFGNISHYSFTIFNRWGQKVFGSAALGSGWDGRVQGSPQPPGVYAWICAYQLQGQEKQIQKGTVMLIR